MLIFFHLIITPYVQMTGTDWVAGCTEQGVWFWLLEVPPLATPG